MKNVQKKVKEFCERYGLHCPLEIRVLDLVSEIGEFAKEVIKATDYGRKEFEFREEIKEELGNVLFSLIVVANQLNIDLADSLDLVLKKYERRIRKKGTASSLR